MMGIYIWPLVENKQMNMSYMKNSPKFMPYNSITEVIQLDNHPNGYMIMPTTY